MGRISLFYDVLHRHVISSSLDKYTCSEKTQFSKFESDIKENDVLLMDGYYAKKSILEAIIDRKSDFVVPLTDKFIAVRRFLKHKKKKQTIQCIKFTDSRTKESIEITGRLMKKKVGKKHLVLFTSLMEEDTYSTVSIFHLYLKRWQVETCFLQLKNTLELVNWTGTSSLAVQQDFKVKILLYNLSSALTLRLNPPNRKKDKRNRPTKRKRQLNFSFALGRAKILIEQIAKQRDIIKSLKEFLVEVKRCLEYSRKGQSIMRKYWEGKTYHMNQKHA